MDNATNDDAAGNLLGLALRLAWLLGGELQSLRGRQPTLRQFRVLHLLAERPHRAGQLATSTEVTAASITLVAGVLEEQGWVQRTPDPDDRRATLLSLTPTGERVLADAETHLHQLLLDVVQGLEPSQLAALSSLAGPLHTGIDRIRASRGREPDGIPGTRRRSSTAGLQT